MIYGCYSKENDSRVEQERCKYLEDPRGKPHKCRRSKCSAEQYVKKDSVVLKNKIVLVMNSFHVSVALSKMNSR